MSDNNVGATNGASKVVGIKVKTDGKGKVVLPDKGFEIEGIQPGEQTISIPLVPNKEREDGRGE